jgi:hypothetical protein
MVISLFRKLGEPVAAMTPERREPTVFRSFVIRCALPLDE